MQTLDWYLYALFFLFLFIPCLKTKKQAVLLFTFSFFARILYLTCSYNSIQLPYILSSTFARMIWFIIGMCLAFDMFDLTSILSKIIMMVRGITALVLSIYFYRRKSRFKHSIHYRIIICNFYNHIITKFAV